MFGIEFAGGDTIVPRGASAFSMPVDSIRGKAHG